MHIIQYFTNILVKYFKLLDISITVFTTDSSKHRNRETNTLARHCVFISVYCRKLFMHFMTLFTSVYIQCLSHCLESRHMHWHGTMWFTLRSCTSWLSPSFFTGLDPGDPLLIIRFSRSMSCRSRILISSFLCENYTSVICWTMTKVASVWLESGKFGLTSFKACSEHCSLTCTLNKNNLYVCTITTLGLKVSKAHAMKHCTNWHRLGS